MTLREFTEDIGQMVGFVCLLCLIIAPVSVVYYAIDAPEGSELNLMILLGAYFLYQRIFNEKTTHSR